MVPQTSHEPNETVTNGTTILGERTYADRSATAQPHDNATGTVGTQRNETTLPRNRHGNTTATTPRRARHRVTPRSTTARHNHTTARQTRETAGTHTAHRPSRRPPHTGLTSQLSGSSLSQTSHRPHQHPPKQSAFSPISQPPNPRHARSSAVSQWTPCRTERGQTPACCPRRTCTRRYSPSSDHDSC